MDKEIKAYLADSELLLNAVGEGIYGLDTQGRAIFINPAAEAMTGWSYAELLGQNIHQFHHHSYSNGEPYPACECKIFNTALDGISRQVSGEVFWRKDGSNFPVEYTTRAVYKNNHIIGAVAVFRDVSQQQQIELALRSALENVQSLTEQLQAENTYLQNELAQEWSSAGLVGRSPIITKMLSQVELVAQTDSTVLILGENGTGKELVARNIHALSQRKNSTMVKVNCAAFAPSLLESELFGHEKGAFTGATERRKGRFELATGGTLFLDEIGELSMAAQGKLLRVLQEQEFERVGGSETVKVNIRVIAATNRDLSAMITQGTFRIDLFYRLNVFPVTVPPLRDRQEDIPLLSQVIISTLNKTLGKNISAISNRSLTQLMQYQWPGNIRELQNVLEREMILTKSTILNFNFKTSSKSLTPPVIETLAQVEARYILSVLKACKWRIGGEIGAAKQLGLPESTLRSRMSKLKIVRPN
ncbi:sigma 54-interacting transcriptional regulator [Colwellia sp. MB3u-70]|uniref:sigma-54 interaction domain-containing protein n=1 Tax=unclassified Colwellia TaxID=196834 RepID=UPI0015F37273|nr:MULTISPECIES: sigma 54-interacting transcriptional regulator [unclassified Colwellia]MBA6294009.1 sigma 54-interacting transcriptional regulator [Colwellia sp. MB3u-8]MBA6307550.1 sigma 54-interacting transcriptional regulator [Colwellia sp. MB3u-70]